MRLALVTLLLFGLLVCAVLVMGKQLRDSSRSEVRQILQAWKEQGQLPDDYDISAGEFHDMGTEVDERLMLRIQLADMIEGTPWLWMPVCLVAAMLLAAALIRLSQN
jgi:hypothetical protein